MFKHDRTLAALCLITALISSNLSWAKTHKPLTCEFNLAQQSITLEIANQPHTRQKGLMHRTSLPRNHGMLFVFEKPGQASFWMKNTLIPLSIGYFDKNWQLLELYDMQPHDLSAVRSQSNQIKYALEMNQGWFQQHQITAANHPILKKKAKFQLANCEAVLDNTAIPNFLSYVEHPQLLYYCPY